MLGDPFFNQVISGVTSVLRPLGLHMVLMMTGKVTTDQVVTDLRRGRLDGVILIHSDLTDPLPGLLVEAGLPAVLCGRPRRPLKITYVDADQAAGATLAAERLVSIGRKRVATISARWTAPPPWTGSTGSAPRWPSAVSPTLSRCPATSPGTAASRRWSGCSRRCPIWTGSSSPRT